ncbi:MAG: hypothetical protein WEA08_03860 [Woeseia sp.]
MMEIPWLDEVIGRWMRQQEQGRVPHAVMLIGSAGVGKRCAAAWLAQRALNTGNVGPRPVYPLTQPVHPDLYWLTPLPEKQVIGVDQIRELVGELSLTSHDGGGKVAVIDPANAMTASAANSLLKTLEEPPGDALILLIADRRGWLPATIFSRCQRMAVPLPDEATALAWLDGIRPGAAWPAALQEAGGAPLAAISALDRLDETAVMARDLAAVAGRQASPIDVAERWAKHNPDFVLDWLGRQVRHRIVRASGGVAMAGKAPMKESVEQRMDSRNLFCYLDMINGLKGQAAGSFNLQLTLESLLIDWAEGLAHCRPGAQSTARLQLLGAQ